MATPTGSQPPTIALGAGLLHAEFFRVGGPDGPLLARIVGASGALHYFSPARNAVHSLPSIDRLADRINAPT